MHIEVEREPDPIIRAHRIEFVCCMFVTVVSYVITAQSESHLRDRLAAASQGYTNAIAADSSLVFDRLLERVAKNFLNIFAYMAADYRRNAAVFQPMPSYYEWIDTLPQPAAYDSRYNSTVSFADGGYSVSRLSHLDQPSFSTALNQTISNTQPSMTIMKKLFELNPSFVAGYYCISGETSINPRHLFREFPAVSNGNFAQLLAYDCAQDDWYEDGANGARVGNEPSSTTPRATTYTSAYIDPWIHQTMITIAMPLYDPVTDEFLGVAGADLLTTSIQRSIEGVRYLKNGRAILFEVDPVNPNDGVVIADTARTLTAQQTTLQSYTSLQHPTISSDTWTNMYQPGLYQPDSTMGEGDTTIPPALSTFIELESDDGSKWFVASKGLSRGEGKYILSIFVLQSDVTGVLDPVLDAISSARRTAIIVVCVVCGVVLLLAALVTVALARKIVDPVTKLTMDSQRIIDRIGHDNMLKKEGGGAAGAAGGGGGGGGIIADSSISETRLLQQAHRRMIENIEAAQREQNAQAANQQMQQRIDYALPAYDPAANFDQSFIPVANVPGGASSPNSPPSALNSPVLPMGVLLQFDTNQQQQQQQQPFVQPVQVSPYAVSAIMPPSASLPYGTPLLNYPEGATPAPANHVVQFHHD